MVRHDESPRNVFDDVRTPVAGFFINFLKHRIMETKINLVPLADMLQVEGISPNEMSNFFDELSYDYVRTITELQVADLSPRSILHEETSKFLYLLRELRDVFQQCSF